MNHQIISLFCTNPKTFYTQCHCRGVIGQKLKTLTWDRRFFSQWAQSGATEHVCCFTTLFCDANIVCWHTMGQTLWLWSNVYTLTANCQGRQNECLSENFYIQQVTGYHHQVIEHFCPVDIWVSQNRKQGGLLFFFLFWIFFLVYLSDDKFKREPIIIELSCWWCCIDWKLEFQVYTKKNLHFSIITQVVIWYSHRANCKTVNGIQKWYICVSNKRTKKILYALSHKQQL